MLKLLLAVVAAVVAAAVETIVEIIVMGVLVVVVIADVEVPTMIVALQTVGKEAAFAVALVVVVGTLVPPQQLQLL